MIVILTILFIVVFFGAGALWLNLLEETTDQDEAADDGPKESRPRT